MGDTIRVTQALQNNSANYEAYQQFINSEEGQAFSKLFSEGGKFGDVLVTFDVSYDLDAGTRGVTTPLARDADGNTERLYAQDDIDQRIAPEGARTTLASGETLAFDVQIGAMTAASAEDPRNVTNKALTNLHESQHVDIVTRDVRRDGQMNYGGYNQHLMMKDPRYGNYLQQRINFYQQRRPDLSPEVVKKAVSGFSNQ